MIQRHVPHDLISPNTTWQRTGRDMSIGPVDMITWAVDAQDKLICTAWRRRFYKSPGFDGKNQEPVNCQESIDRSMTYLLPPARDKVEPFEGDMPRSCWSCCEESISGQRRLMAFSALYHPSFIFAYLDYARQFPDSKLTLVAVKQAEKIWRLTAGKQASCKLALQLIPILHY